MSIFSKLFKSNRSVEADILNSGLYLAMEFGKNWLQPIQDRLKIKYSQLTTEELNNFDAVCRQARDKGCDFVYKRLMTLCNNHERIRKKELKNAFNSFIREQYTWISKRNSRRLFSQSLYYAWKDGWGTCIDR